MARPPRFTISALADLLRELRYAPPETLHRQMTAAEALLGEIDPERNYPEDYIRYRITGYRGESAGGSLFVGSALIGDLAIFVERLSASLALPVAEFAPRQPLLPEEVARRLGVSAITLHRYRRQGLVAHQAVLGGGRPRLVYFTDAVERFAARAPRRVEAAGRFSRIDPATRERMIRRARRYAASLDLSLNEAARRLAKRFGRSHEGIRRLLQQHDRRRPAEAIFHDARPLSERQRRLALRAHDRALPASEVAQRLGKTVSSVYRTTLEQRAQRLRAWNVNGRELPTFRLEGAGEVILAADSAVRGLPVVLDVGGELTAWIGDAAALEIRREVEEAQLAAALHYLLWSTRRIIDDLPRHQPRAAEIDEAETRLRWATRLKVRLLTGLRAAALSTIEIHLGRKLLQCAAGEIDAAYRLALGSLSRSIDAFDASRQGRLRAVAVHALRTELARGGSRSGPPSTARARHDQRSLVLPDLPALVFAWRSVLEPRAGAIAAAEALSEEDRRILAARFGWTGGAPQTHAAIAAALGRPVHRIAAAEHRARRRLAQQLRRESQDGAR